MRNMKSPAGNINMSKWKNNFWCHRRWKYAASDKTCLTLGKLLHFPKPWFHHLLNGTSTIYFTRLVLVEGRQSQPIIIATLHWAPILPQSLWQDPDICHFHPHSITVEEVPLAYYIHMETDTRRLGTCSATQRIKSKGWGLASFISIGIENFSLLSIIDLELNCMLLRNHSLYDMNPWYLLRILL